MTTKLNQDEQDLLSILDSDDADHATEPTSVAMRDNTITRRDGRESMNCRGIEQAMKKPDGGGVVTDGVRLCIDNIVRASIAPWKIASEGAYVSTGLSHQVYRHAISWMTRYVLNVHPTERKYAYMTPRRCEDVLCGVPGGPSQSLVKTGRGVREREMSQLHKMYAVLFSSPIMSIEPGCACWGDGENMVS